MHHDQASRGRPYLIRFWPAPALPESANGAALVSRGRRRRTVGGGDERGEVGVEVDDADAEMTFLGGATHSPVSKNIFLEF